MKAFIKLTQTGSDDFEGRPIYIDVTKIVSIEEGAGRTQLSTDNDYFFVKESVKDIFEIFIEYDYDYDILIKPRV